MRFVIKVSGILLLVLFVSGMVWAQARVEIENEEVEVKVGESIQVEATYYDAEGYPIDTVFTWSVTPSELGTIDKNGNFTGEKAGEGDITAAVGDLTDTVEVEVEGDENEDEDEDEEEEEEYEITILNDDLKLAPGETEQIEALLVNENEDTLDVNFSWFVNPGYLGQISETGLFTAEHPGEGEIVVKYKQWEEEIEVEIEAEDEEEEEEEEKNDIPEVEIVTKRINPAPGDSVQLAAVYKNSTGDEVDTVFTWSVSPDSLGEFKNLVSGMFYALKAGKGVVTATVGDYSDDEEVDIEYEEEEEEEEEDDDDDLRLRIIPGDTTVIVGATVRFRVQYKTANDTYADTSGTWELAADDVGTISEDTGLLQTLTTGVTVVKVEVGDSETSAEIRIIENPQASAGPNDINSIHISRVLPDGHVLPPQHLEEGGVYQIGGLPYPLDLLNGGVIHFPAGCLHQDIAIHILLPENAEENTSGVNFSDGSVTGVRFVVMIGDSMADPFYFDKPLNLALPFKEDRLEEMGLHVNDLGIYFADERTYDLDGLTDITVDSTAEKIYAHVAHFSTIVIRDKKDTETLTGIQSVDIKTPAAFRLDQNYPNPFNPKTVIAFRLERSAHVEIAIYNYLGQKIKILVNKQATAGSHTTVWNGQDKKRNQVASGIYFYDLKINGKRLMTRRMILIR